jgi:hypothetical protein
MALQPRGQRESILSPYAKPWNDAGWNAPAAIYAPKGMIGPEERRCYYWLAQHWLKGDGCIVDAGAFVGASTHCFAAGAASAGRRGFQGRPLIHAYDYFEVVDTYVGSAITEQFRPIEVGESYLDIFREQIIEYDDMIAAHSGDFLKQTWGGDPIEILFVDISKTQDLNSHVIECFFSSLIPHQSIVIHQDYFHCWHPYIHVTMEYLSPEFELIDEHVDYQSRVWRLARPISLERLKRAIKYDFSSVERQDLLHQLIEKSSAFSRPMIEVVRLWQQVLDGDLDTARRNYRRLTDLYGVDVNDSLWAVQARDIAHQYLR